MSPSTVIKKTEGRYQVIRNKQLEKIRWFLQQIRVRQSQQVSIEYPLYKRPYDLKFCRTFEAMSLKDRDQLVREAMACRCCLKRGRGIKQCKSQSICQVDCCISRHHSKLHGAPTLYSKTSYVSYNPTLGQSIRIDSPFNGHCGLLSSVILTVVPVNISVNGSTLW